MIVVYYPIAAARAASNKPKLPAHVNWQNEEMLGSVAGSDKRARAAPAASLMSHQYPKQVSRRLGWGFVWCSSAP